MATLLYRLGKTAFRRWPIFIAGWLIALIGIGATAGAIAKPMVDTFTIPGIESLKAQDLQKELFGGNADAMETPTVNVVVSAPKGEKLADPQNSAAVDALIKDISALPQIPKDAQILNPVVAAEAMTKQLVDKAVAGGTPRDVAEANAAVLSPLSKDGRTGIISYGWTGKIQDLKPTTTEKLKDVLAANSKSSGLTIEANGNGMQSMPEMGYTSELIGIGFAAVVLLIAFGSMVAAGIPIVTALVGVAIGMMGVTISTAFTDVGTSTPMLATMLGLAVGIDYALFILSRYRTELQHTDDRQEAMGRAVATAGSAVVFAGMTVLIALSALSVVGIPFLTAMGMAAALTVLTAVLVALTLLPAVLGMLGKRAFGARVRRDKVKREDSGLVINNGVRWARLIAKKPLAFVIMAVVLLGALALPIQGLRLALPTDATAAKSTTQRQASDIITQAFGPGREAPMIVVVDARKAADPAKAIGEVTTWAADHNGVLNAQTVGVTPTGDGATVLVTPKSGPDQEATTTLLENLRESSAAIQSKTGTTVGVTGLTPIMVDVSAQLSEALPVYLAVVIGLAFLLLMVVFRSILVPLTATLGFLLSVLATLGATVWVFSDGAFGLVDGAPLVSFLPIILIGIVFGLAMDYQVFLVTRMREMYVHGDSAHQAVEDGFRHGARVVTAAALIMIAVFAAFMAQPDSLIKSIGFALAAAIFFDAFIVRMTLIPAAMYLMGDKAWWLPSWLDRILPKIDIEGEGLRTATDWDHEVSQLGPDYAAKS